MAEEYQAPSEGILHGNVSSKQIDYLGVGLVMMQYIEIHLAEDVPFWIRIAVGTIVAGLTFAVCRSHPGTGDRRSRRKDIGDKT